MHILYSDFLVGVSDAIQSWCSGPCGDEDGPGASLMLYSPYISVIRNTQHAQPKAETAYKWDCQGMSYNDH